MIDKLSSPTVVVVDDEPEDYRAILVALNALHVPSVHYTGDDVEELPTAPLSSVRLIFMDLHLSAAGLNKTAASRAANVFMRIVPETAPAVVVVIWSKYADEKNSAGAEEETEAEVFERTLLEARPRYKGRLMFVRLPKPKAPERPATQEWAEQLKTEIVATVSGRPSVELLWSWEAMLRHAGTRVSEGLSQLAEPLVGTEDKGAPTLDVEGSMQAVLQSLARAQGEGDWSDATSSGHLVAVLNELLADQVQNGGTIADLAKHGPWLTAVPPKAVLGADAVAAINGFLLTGEVQPGGRAFLPGTVYECVDPTEFGKALGMDKVRAFYYECCTPSLVGVSAEDLKNKQKEVIEKWNAAVRPIFLEISAECDVAQAKRPMATLLAGLVIPISQASHAKRGGAFEMLPLLKLRWPGNADSKNAVSLMFCSRYKLTTPSKVVPPWLKPWFRLRAMPTASLRNWHSDNSARVGYVSLRPGASK
jgi:CheY-like chemotaxis protein